MAYGSLMVAFEKHNFDGYAVYDAVFPAVQLGQSASTEFTANFALHYSDVELVLLEASFSIVDPKLAGFRITCNDVTITREFKPHICEKIEGKEGSICKIIYDITPIIKSKKNKNINIIIENYGINSFVVEHVALITLYRIKGATTSIRHYSGILVLGPGEATRFSPFTGSGELEVNIVALIPQSDGRLVVNGREFKGGGFNMYRLRLGQADTIEIGYKGRTDVYPRSAVIVSLLVSRGHVARPNLEISAKRIDKEQVEVVIRNVGQADANNVIAVTLSKGLVLERKILGTIKPGSSETITLRGRDDNVIVRVIWRDLGEIKIKELKIR